MPKNTKIRFQITTPSLFFVTTTFRNWQPFLGSESKRDEFESLLFSLFPSHGDALLAYVIMPEHIHMIVGFRLGGVQLSSFMQALKSLSSRNLFHDEGSIWCRRFDDLVITSDKQLRIKLNYIHENPVRKDLALRPEEWRWSSAWFWMRDELHPVLTRNWNWESECFMLVDEGVHQPRVLFCAWRSLCLADAVPGGCLCLADALVRQELKYKELRVACGW